MRKKMYCSGVPGDYNEKVGGMGHEYRFFTFLGDEQMKSKIGKIVLYVVLGVIVLAGVLVALFAMFGESAIRSAIQRQGSATLGVPVKVDSLNLSVLQGKVGIGGVVVGNPEGYSGNLLELKDGSVDVGIKSLMSDTVHIEDIRLDGMDLVIEQKGLNNNLKEIIDAIPKKEEEAKKEGKPLVIDNLELSNIVVKVKLIDLPGRADTVPLKLEPITMQNLGTEDKVSMATLVSKILVAVATGVAKQGAGVLPDEVTNAVKSGLSGVMQQSEALMKEGQKILEEGSGVLEGVKGIFEKKKE